MRNRYRLTISNQTNRDFYDVHVHDSYELNFILTDDVTIVSNHNVYKTVCGDVFIFPKFSFHSVNAERINYSRICMHFDDSAVLDAAPVLNSVFNAINKSGVNVVHLNGNDIDEFKKLITELESIQNEKGIFSDFEKVSLIGKILSYIASRLNDNPQPEAPKKSDEIADKILSYINENLDKNFSIDEICKEFYISKSALWSIMKTTTGISTKEYITKLRLSRAMSLLVLGMSVTEVSNRCGFNSYAHFIRFFSQKVGCSPYKYGKEHRL